jgi:NAD(P)H-dependent flavin oxidoreductase YrpB (nitropropane dioxygenase family)
MAAALAAGAEGVRMGTRFAAATEANAHPEYVKALVEARAADTVYTGAFHVGWENAPHRALRSSVEAAERFEGEVVGRRYWPEEDRWQDIKRWQSAVATRQTEGEIGAMSLWAGESVGGVKEVKVAREIVEEVAGEAERLLRKW